MPSQIQKSRFAAFKTQNGRCFYCCSPMWLTHKRAFARLHGITRRQADWFACTAEHLRSKSEGGTSRRENIVAACWLCNQARNSSKPQRAWRSFAADVGRLMQKGEWCRMPWVNFNHGAGVGKAYSDLPAMPSGAAMSLSRLSPEELDFLERLATDDRPALITMAMERKLTSLGYLRNIGGQLGVTPRFRADWALGDPPKIGQTEGIGASAPTPAAPQVTR